MDKAMPDHLTAIGSFKYDDDFRQFIYKSRSLKAIDKTVNTEIS